MNFVSREIRNLKLDLDILRRSKQTPRGQAILLIYFPPLLRLWFSSYDECFVKLANTTPSMIAIRITAEPMNAERYLVGSRFGVFGGLLLLGECIIWKGCRGWSLSMRVGSCWLWSIVNENEFYFLVRRNSQTAQGNKESVPARPEECNSTWPFFEGLRRRSSGYDVPRD